VSPPVTVDLTDRTLSVRPGRPRPSTRVDRTAVDRTAGVRTRRAVLGRSRGALSTEAHVVLEHLSRDRYVALDVVDLVLETGLSPLHVQSAVESLVLQQLVRERSDGTRVCYAVS
jgi:hypothetical protein